MSSVTQIVNTLEAMMDDHTTTAENIISFVLVEKWNPAPGTLLHCMDLSPEELELLHCWSKINRYQYKRILDMEKDMDEMFPGLLFATRLIILSEVF